MKPIFKNWTGSITVNGQNYNSVADVDFKGLKGSFCMLLQPARRQTATTTPVPAHTAHTPIDTPTNTIQEVTGVKEFKIRVKTYMTKPATPEFDFMEKWNNNKPMPMVEMAGVKVKETRGMVYMELHGLAEPIITCRRCGKTLTNPISRKYGIGPECMSKLGFAYDINDVEDISKALVDVKWEGWIIKSAILEEEEVYRTE